jgi:hypothetical protein
MNRTLIGDFEQAGTLLRAQITGQGDNPPDTVAFALTFDFDFFVA